MTNSADFWYCHNTEPQPIRPHAQMFASVTDHLDVLRIVQDLRKQEYTVQRAVLRITCTTCNGEGRIGKRPKGVRKRNLPTWMLTYADCAKCAGNGFTSEHEVPLTL